MHRLIGILIESSLRRRVQACQQLISARKEELSDQYYTVGQPQFRGRESADSVFYHFKIYIDRTDSAQVCESREQAVFKSIRQAQSTLAYAREIKEGYATTD